MALTGKANIKFDKCRADSLHLIGSAENPIYVCPKKDVHKLFTSRFRFCYEIWSFFHFGFGLPDGVSWNKLDPDLADTLLMMEQHYQNNFSLDSVNIEYQKGIINHLKAGFRLKG